MRLILGGVFDRYPGARVILGHMGEFLPFQLSRLDSRFEVLEFTPPLEKLPSQYFGTNITVPLAPADQARVAHVNAERILRLN